MKSWKVDFLENVLLGTNTNKNDPNTVLSKCIKLAYKDMMTAGRYYSSMFINSSEEICRIVSTKITENDFCFSRDLISDTSLLFSDTERIGIGNKYVTIYGLAQKLINMTFKYLYAFSDYIFINRPLPDFSNCDCPLDSIILSKANIKGIVWSKLSFCEYVECQDIIYDILKTECLFAELEALGNLAYDFLNW